MRALLAAALLLAPLPAAAQPAPQATQPPPGPAVSLSLQELDQLIQLLAEAPAKWSLVPLNLLLDKRQRATTAEKAE